MTTSSGTSSTSSGMYLCVYHRDCWPCLSVYPVPGPVILGRTPGPTTLAVLPFCPAVLAPLFVPLPCATLTTSASWPADCLVSPSPLAAVPV